MTWAVHNWHTLSVKIDEAGTFTLDGRTRIRTGEALAKGQRLRCEPVGRSYDRVVAACRLPDGRDLGCVAIGAGIAKRWARYDRGGRLRTY